VVVVSRINKNSNPIRHRRAKTIAKITAVAGILLSVLDISEKIHCESASVPIPFGVITLSLVMPISPMVKIEKLSCDGNNFGGGTGDGFGAIGTKIKVSNLQWGHSTVRVSPLAKSLASNSICPLQCWHWQITKFSDIISRPRCLCRCK
jgi:hypothetical protein